MKTLIQVLFFMCCSILLPAQNAGINDDGSTADPSAMLHVESNNKGFILPRMNSTERIGISNPATGLLVFDLDYNAVFLFDGVTWMPLLSGSTEKLPPISLQNTTTGSNIFGTSIALEGGYALVGDPGANSGQGTVFIYNRVNSAWQLVQTLTASDGMAGDHFGFSIDTDGIHILIGAKNVNKAYVFDMGGNFPQKHILTASDATNGDDFGHDVAISEFTNINNSSHYDLYLVGAPYADIGTSTNQGAVYIFSFDSYETFLGEQKLNRSSINPNALFGFSIDAKGSEIVVGAPEATVNTVQQGEVYFYYVIDESTTGIGNTYTASDGAANDAFGYSVAIANTQTFTDVFVGAPNASVNGIFQQGAVYVASQNGIGSWAHKQKISEPNGKASNFFGKDIATKGVLAPVAIGSINSVSLCNLSSYNWYLDSKIPSPIKGIFGTTIAIGSFYSNHDLLILATDFYSGNNILYLKRN